MKRSGSLVVKHHSPLQRWGMLLGSILAMLSISWGLYIYGKKNAGYDQLEASAMEDRLRTTIESLKQERDNLRDQIALLERSNQMDKQAYVEVDVNLKSLQEEILELREEVSFYRGIVSPNESSAGLRVERIRVSQSGEDRLYHYELVLSQVLKNDRTVSGQAEFVIDGLQDGRPRELDLSDVAVKGKRNLGFKFKYFQKFDGDIELPEGYTPRSIQISVRASRQKQIESSFDWASVTSTNDASLKSAETASTLQ
ncbi:MAG: hypothetical protein OEZ43_16975 [Gammaproteobacteria bacterium]|nr:hypothetical protein [Gammaproteobacteria bacterium]